MCRSNKESTENKGKTWSRGTNSRLPFGVNVNLNLSSRKPRKSRSHVTSSLFQASDSGEDAKDWERREKGGWRVGRRTKKEKGRETRLSRSLEQAMWFEVDVCTATSLSRLEV